MANKVKWMAAVLVVIAFLSSCHTNVLNVNTFSKDYTVTTWQKGTDDVSGLYYYCEISEPNLTQYIYDNSTMQSFLYTNNGNVSPLPFNDYWVDESDPNNIYRYTEQITCEFVPGYITFIIKSSDHQDILPHYARYDFNVRFMW